MVLVVRYYVKRLVNNMKQEDLKQLQYQQLLIMDDIHRVCVNNNLRYYLIGGSALGAVRHHGFIPWDVDIDIIMPRLDYEKFLKIAPMQLDRRFKCHDYRTDSKYSLPHAIVIMNNSYVKYSYSDNNPSLRPEGIYVDILPLDYVSSELDLQHKHARKLHQIKTVKYLKESKIYISNNLITKIFKYILRLVFLPIPWRYLNHKQQIIAQRFNHIENPTLCCSTLSHYKYSKLVMPIDYFGKPRLMQFENRKYYCPEEVHKYLTHLFGDYMKLPPIEIQQRYMQAVISASWPKEN